MTQFGRFSSSGSASGRASLLTYEPYYGLPEKPFSLSSDPRFLHKSPAHAPTFDDLRAGIRRREGLIVLTGDIGTGKTTLCKAVLEDLDRKTFSTFVADPFLAREDLLKMLLVDFGVMSIDDLRSGRLTGASRPELSYPLYDFLRALVPLKAFAVLIIDEAQNLSLSLLEEIRILSDLEAPEKLLQVVLVGQLELQEKLKLPEMRQVDQRVSVRCELKPMSREAVSGYIAHRLEVAGGGHNRAEFSPEAIDEIYRVSKGVPRAVNLICDRALHHGYVERSARILPSHVVRATVDLGMRKAGDVQAAERSSRLPPDDLLETRRDPVVLEPAEEEPVEAVPVPSAAKVPGTLVLETPQPAIEGFGAFGIGRKVENTSDRRRWPRRAFAAIASILAASAVLVALSSLQSRAAGPGPGGMLPTLPPAPQVKIDRSVDLPMRIAASIARAEPPGLYAINVALFGSVDRSTDLVDRLTSAGYRAYSEGRLLPRGRFIGVRIGPYIIQADADADLARIREIPGYTDARVVTILSAAAAAAQ